MKKILSLFVIATILVSCNSSKNISGNDKTSKTDTTGSHAPEPVLYRASNTVTNEIKDTKLDVRFDWSKKYMYGKATLTIKPHFYPVTHLDLNARGMELKEISLMDASGNKKPLKYVYENDSIKIELDRSYTREEQYVIYIDYIAKPEELKKVGGSAAINSDKGLYFINADGADKNKPQQIWTQGETQSNQVWMPTIDSPNQRMFQEISITVDTPYVTLSNGLLINQKDNGNGTRTDIWKMGYPHAPYLAMMAIGKFAVVKDHWRDKQVNYYVEPEYEQYAAAIFGNTPQMLECFSTKLGVDYAWEKYSQVIVRDYVSGAMENTTATLHGSFLQLTKREMIDDDFESVISHELFHQWFGDLVTCESWSNIPLNESFATYGEYIWNEYKYGRDMADYEGQSDLNKFFLSVGSNPVNLIRFVYKSREDMFDGTSYEKGGRVLHMLRKTVGDDAFFLSLKDYLNTNRFTAVEAHNLRLSFEKITGQDLNWFWNEWFFNKGNPVLDISYTYDDSLKKAKVIVQQKQDFAFAPLYKLPVDVDVYINGKAERHRITITHAKEEFAFDATSKPELINFDAEKMLLCKKTDNHSAAEWVYMYNHAPLYLDRSEALSKLKNYKVGTDKAVVMMAALKDPFYSLRRTAITNIGTLAKDASTKTNVKTELIKLATFDTKSTVRVAALNALKEYYGDDEDVLLLMKNALNDSSYNVIENAMKNITKKDSVLGMQLAKQYETNSDEHIQAIVANVYKDYGNDSNNSFMMALLKNAKPKDQYELLSYYSTFIKRCKPETTEKGIALLEDYARNAQSKWVRLTARNSCKEFIVIYDTQSKELKSELDQMKKSGKSEAEMMQLQSQYDKLIKMKESIQINLDDIEKNEKDEMLKNIYNNKTYHGSDDDE